MSNGSGRCLPGRGNFTGNGSGGSLTLPVFLRWGDAHFSGGGTPPLRCVRAECKMQKSGVPSGGFGQIGVWRIKPSPLGRVPPERGRERFCGSAALFRHGFAVPPGGELPRRGKRDHPGVSPKGKALCGFAALFRQPFGLPPGGELPRRGFRDHPGVSPKGKAGALPRQCTKRQFTAKGRAWVTARVAPTGAYI